MGSRLIGRLADYYVYEFVNETRKIREFNGLSMWGPDLKTAKNCVNTRRILYRRGVMLYLKSGFILRLKKVTEKLPRIYRLGIVLKNLPVYKSWVWSIRTKLYDFMVDQLIKINEYSVGEVFFEKKLDSE